MPLRQRDHVRGIREGPGQGAALGDTGFTPIDTEEILGLDVPGVAGPRIRRHELALEDPAGSASTGQSTAQTADSAQATSRRGVLVEFVRLIMVALFAAGGWEISVSVGGPNSTTHLVGIVLGSGVGYVLGGVFGRHTATAVSELEREFRRIPAAEILAGGIGLILGLVLATLFSLPLYHLPRVAAYASVAFAYATIGYFAWKVGRGKSDELFALFGVKPRAAGTAPGEMSVIDTSAILDGRLLALAKLGFLTGTVLMPRSVLEEVQSVADSSNDGRRARGRRGLEVLIALKRHPAIDLVLVEGEPSADAEAVDAELVRMAKNRGAVLVTNDSNLAKVAVALDVPVRSIHALADALRPQVVAGEQVALRLTRRGRETGQAVGYLDDGTMVVVEEADHLIGQQVSVTVTNALQTSTGQMVFARIAGAD